MISAPVELEGALCLGDLHLGADPHLGGDDGRGADVAQVAQAIRRRSSSNVREGFEIVVLDDYYALAVETNILVTNLNLFLSE